MSHFNDEFPDELRPVADRLRDERPTASAMELDQVKQRVIARMASASGTRRNQGFMRSRVAILSALVLGFALSSTGAGLAITGFTDDQASVNQYPQAPPAATPNTPAPETVIPVVPEDQGVAGEEEQDDTNASPSPSNDEAQSAPAEEVQTTRQVEAGTAATGNQLPFTGFAAIPVLLLGLALLSAGLVMRRSSQQG
jgi:hypothetical protein